LYPSEFESSFESSFESKSTPEVGVELKSSSALYPQLSPQQSLHFRVSGSVTVSISVISLPTLDSPFAGSLGRARGKDSSDHLSSKAGIGFFPEEGKDEKNPKEVIGHLLWMEDVPRKVSRWVLGFLGLLCRLIEEGDRGRRGETEIQDETGQTLSSRKSPVSPKIMRGSKALAMVGWILAREKGRALEDQNSKGKKGKREKEGLKYFLNTAKGFYYHFLYVHYSTHHVICHLSVK
jgi:hypothetical protein